MQETTKIKNRMLKSRRKEKVTVIVIGTEIVTETGIEIERGGGIGTEIETSVIVTGDVIEIGTEIVTVIVIGIQTETAAGIVTEIETEKTAKTLKGMIKISPKDPEAGE